MKSIGIEIRKDSWVVVGMKTTSLGVEPLGYRCLTGASIEDRLKELQEFVKENSLEGSVSAVAMPGEKFVSRVLRVPAPGPDALDGVIRFELEKHLPFKVDDASYGYQVFGNTGGRYVVLATAIRKDLLEDAIEPLRAAGLEPAYAGPRETALFNAFDSIKLLPGAEPCVLVDITNDGTRVTAFSGGMPEDSRSVRSGGDDRGAWAEKLAGALKASVRSVEARQAERSGATVRVLVSSETLSEESLFSGLESEAGVAVERVSFTGYELPPSAAAPFGLALAALGKAPLTVNVLPEFNGKKPGTFFFHTAVLAGVVAVLFAAVGVSYLARDLLMLKRIEAKVAELRVQTNRLRATSDELKSLNRGISTLNKADGRTDPVVLDILKELTMVLPRDTWLTGFEIEDGEVFIDGFSGQASSLLLKMEQSEYIKDVEFVGQITKDRDGKELFRIKAAIRG